MNFHCFHPTVEFNWHAPAGKSTGTKAAPSASGRVVAVGQLDNPVSEKETQHARDEFRDTKHEIAQRGGGGGIAVLIRLQEVFKKAVEATQKVIQAVKDDEKADASDDDAKKFGCFHIVTR